MMFLCLRFNFGTSLIYFLELKSENVSLMYPLYVTRLNSEVQF